MRTSEQIRDRLLLACDDEHLKARQKDRGSVSPDPSKLIVEGISKGKSIIQNVPLDPDPGRYVDTLSKSIEALRSEQRSLSTDDEDGYLLGGMATVARLIEKEYQLDTRTVSWWDRFVRFLRKDSP